MCELILLSQQKSIIKKSSLCQHVESKSFVCQQDIDRLARTTLIVDEEQLRIFIDQRTQTMKDIYCDCLLKTNERRQFIQQHIIPSTQRLSYLSIQGSSRLLVHFIVIHSSFSNHLSEHSYDIFIFVQYVSRCSYGLNSPTSQSYEHLLASTLISSMTCSINFLNDYIKH
jgi:hypothetical protein